MATHDYNLANQSGASFRSDLNNALSAILSNNSNASSPAVTVAYMIWADTNNNKLKIRNSANSAWVELINLDGTIDRDITFTGASANILFDASQNSLEFADNAEATFGNSRDLVIKHDGSNSIINDTGTGELRLQRAGDTMMRLNGTGIQIEDPDGTAAVTIIGHEGNNANLYLTADEGDDNGDQWLIQSQASSGKLKLYNDISGSPTEVWAIAGDGDITMTGHLKIPDNHELQLGSASGGDFILFHDGSNSILRDRGTGEFQLQRGSDTLLTLNSTGIEVKDPSGTARVTVTGFEGASAQVFLAADEGDDNGDTWAMQSTFSDNSFRLTNDVSGGQSTKWSLDTSGNVIQYGELDLPDDKKIKLGNADDLQFYHSGTESFIADEGTGGITISSGLLSFKNQARDELHATMTVNDAVKLYFDNELRFETTASGAKVTRTGTSSDTIFVILAQDNANCDATLQLETQDDTAHSRVNFGDSSDSDVGRMDYDHNANHFTFRISADNKYEMDASAFHSSDDNLRDLGTSSLRWDDVRATNGSIQTSDRNEKNTIVASDLGLDFINKLSPVSYKFNNKTRTHYGLIAQDIETVLGTLSKSATDFAGFCKDQITTKNEIDEDGNSQEVTLETPFDRYGLRYTEFIAPMIKAIQELSAKVTALEGS